MTPWRLRRRLHRWIILQLTGLDFGLDAPEAIEPEKQPESAEDRVVSVPDDSPFLGADGAGLIAKPRPTPSCSLDDPPLRGSVEERAARARPRW